jgi:hypothetical protein
MPNKDKTEKLSAECDGAKTVIVNHTEKPAVIICDVCGHVNPENTALCKMCSNYLKGAN